MGCTTRLTTHDCFYDQWKMCRGVYWSLNGAKDGRYANVIMSREGGSCPSSGTKKQFYVNKRGTFNEFTVNVIRAGDSSATIEVWRTEELEPDMTKGQIISNHSDKLGYAVGDIIKSECVVKNIGGAGTIYLTIGVGYIDSSNMIFLTGNPTTDQLFLNYQQLYTFREDVRVDITDYYRQQGIGWAYLQQQMYLFFLVGHKVNGDIIWDTERHISIYLEPDGDFTDPTSLPEVLPDLPGVGDIIPDVGDVLPSAGDVVNWVVDVLTPEPKPGDESPGLMPFLYIGFMGFIGYLLLKSQ